ncbi:MAG: type-F conjugative transfer system secretin TraK [Neisseriaceae bacterium]|nr:type-F conjugative transfer system secretin TraK [Neisseriaceae bacterium]
MNNSNRHHKKYLSGSLKALPLLCVLALSACATVGKQETQSNNTPKPFVYPKKANIVYTDNGFYETYNDVSKNKSATVVETPTVATTLENGETHYTSAKIIQENQADTSVQAAQKPVAQSNPLPAPQPIQIKKVVPADDYAARRSVSVIPDNGKAYVNKNANNKPKNRVQNVVSQYGENHEVNISYEFPNIILTPFQTARAMGLDTKDYDMGNNGKAIIIKPRLDKKLWISITDENNPGGIPISLTLNPKKGMNSQTIVASVATGTSNLSSSMGYQQSLSDVLKAIANKTLPDGYVIRPLNHRFTMANGVTVRPVEQYSGNQFEVYRYRLSNKTRQQQTLAEEMFANDSRVVAVSFYPKTILNHGDSTDVLIMVAKGRE